VCDNKLLSVYFNDPEGYATQLLYFATKYQTYVSKQMCHFQTIIEILNVKQEAVSITYFLVSVQHNCRIFIYVIKNINVCSELFH
jgi:hypothetical protein